MTVTDDELRRSVNQAVQEIGKRFYGSEWPMRNDANIYQALNILQVDIAGALERADDMQAARDVIDDIIDHTDNPAVIRQYVSIDAAWRDAEIRRDWASALRAVKHGEDLSHDIDEAALMSSHQYDKLLNEEDVDE